MLQHLTIFSAFIRTLCFIGLFSLAANTLANHEETHGEKNISIDGFASFVAAKPLTSELSFNDYLQEDDNIDLRNHNVLGIRLTADLDDKLSLTAQMVSKGVNDYEADFDWIYAEYAVSSQWHIAIGRIRTPLFMYSEFVDVGYAYQWVQAPSQIYNYVDYPFQSMESIRLRYNVVVNDWENEFTAWMGSTTDPIHFNGMDTELQLTSAWGIAFSTNYQWITLRGVYFTSLTSLDLSDDKELGKTNSNMPFTDSQGNAQSYFDELAELDDKISIDISKDIKWEDDRGEYLSVGIALDFDYIFVNAELTQTTVKDTLVVPEITAGYAMLGYQINPSWSISYTYGAYKHSVVHTASKNLDGLATSNPAIAPEIAIFQAVTQNVETNLHKSKSQSDTFNVRYDFHPKAALKLEYWQEHQQAPNTNNHPKGLRLGLDLIF